MSPTVAVLLPLFAACCKKNIESVGTASSVKRALRLQAPSPSQSPFAAGTSNDRPGLHLNLVMKKFRFVMNANSLCQLLLTAYFPDKEIGISAGSCWTPLRQIP